MRGQNRRRIPNRPGRNTNRLATPTDSGGMAVSRRRIAARILTIALIIMPPEKKIIYLI